MRLFTMHNTVETTNSDYSGIKIQHSNWYANTQKSQY